MISQKRSCLKNFFETNFNPVFRYNVTLTVPKHWVCRHASLYLCLCFGEKHILFFCVGTAEHLVLVGRGTNDWCGTTCVMVLLLASGPTHLPLSESDFNMIRHCEPETPHLPSSHSRAWGVCLAATGQHRSPRRWIKMSLQVTETTLQEHWDPLGRAVAQEVGWPGNRLLVRSPAPPS